MDVVEERADVPVRDASCSLRLLVPEPRDRPGPAVVLAPGFGGTADRLVEIARGFARAGILAAALDYRGFGGSGGTPRQVVDVAAEQADLRAALEHVRARDDVDGDRVSLWGVSLGGALAISVAAIDGAVERVVAEVPFNGFPRRVAGRSRADTARLALAIADDVVRGLVGARPRTIPLIGRPGRAAVVATPEAQRHRRRVAATSPAWTNRVAARGLFSMMRYRPADDAARLGAPLLVCVAERDTEAPPEAARELARRAVRGRSHSYPNSHFDFYADPVLRDRLLADEVAFLLEGHDDP
jgi:uncharacterized protein